MTKPKTKIVVGEIFNTGFGYIRIDGKRVFMDVEAFEGLKTDMELVLNHYYLRKKGYKISKPSVGETRAGAMNPETKHVKEDK